MIYLVQGPPGAGKSCICRYLSKIIGCVYYSKDDIKELLFDSLGTKDLAWSKQLAIAANDILFSLMHNSLLASQNIVIETNISLERDLENAKTTFSDKSSELIEIYLTAKKDTLIERIIERWESGNRHPGHADKMRIKEIETYIDRQISTPINLGHRVIEVDTSSIDIIEAQNLITRELNLAST